MLENRSNFKRCWAALFCLAHPVPDCLCPGLSIRRCAVPAIGVSPASINQHEKQSICSAVRSFVVPHGRLCRVGLVLLSALGSAAPALAFGPPTLKADDKNPSSVKATLSVQGLPDSGDPNFSTSAGVVFADGYPAPFGPFPGGRRTFSGSAYWHNDGGQSCSRPFDTSSAANKSFGYSDFTVSVYDDQTQSQSFSATVPGTQTIGTSVCMVVAPDPNKPGSFIPLPGVVLTMFKQFTDDSPINGRPFGKSLTLGLRSMGGKSLTYATFGIDKTNTIKTDSPYPSGLSTDTFAFVAHLDGYKDVTNIGAVNARPGTAWPGVAMLLILQPASSSSDSSASADGVDPAAAASAWDGTGTPPASGGGSTGGGTGTGDGSGFFSGFWDRLQTFFHDMFTPDPADLQSLVALKDKFMAWGPLGFPTSVAREFTNAFTHSGNGDGSDPLYWDFPLVWNPNIAGRGGVSYPNGYNPDAAYQAPAPQTAPLVQSFMPSHLNLAPYATWILRGRLIALIALWSSVGFALLRRFTPDLKV